MRDVVRQQDLSVKTCFLRGSPNFSPLYPLLCVKKIGVDNQVNGLIDPCRFKEELLSSPFHAFWMFYWQLLGKSPIQPKSADTVPLW